MHSSYPSPQNIKQLIELFHRHTHRQTEGERMRKKKRQILCVHTCTQKGRRVSFFRLIFHEGESARARTLFTLNYITRRPCLLIGRQPNFFKFNVARDLTIKYFFFFFQKLNLSSFFPLRNGKHD